MESEKDQEFFFDLNFKLCKNIISARSFVRFICFFVSFSTHFPTATHANAMDAMLCCVMFMYVCLYVQRSHCAKQNSLKMICRVPHK